MVFAAVASICHKDWFHVMVILAIMVSALDVETRKESLFHCSVQTVSRDEKCLFFYLFFRVHVEKLFRWVYGKGRVCCAQGRRNNCFINFFRSGRQFTSHPHVFFLCPVRMRHRTEAGIEAKAWKSCSVG